MTSADTRSITDRQNDDDHLQRLLGYSYEYRLAQRWYALRSTVTLALALSSPLAVIFAPRAGDYLAAAAAFWLVLGRTLFAAAEEAHKSRAAAIQELYDTRLFKLPWNPGLAGRPPAPEDVHAAASRMQKRIGRYRDWYTVELSGVTRPTDVLLCQRQSAVWSRRDHRAYAITLAGAAAIWVAIGLAIAIVRDMTIADGLVKLFLPSAPAYLDAVEMSRAHWQHANDRAEFEDEITNLFEARQADPNVPTEEDCRRIQDVAYALRRAGPRVPTWFYRLRKSRMDSATVGGARSLLQDPTAQ